ncbi:MAG: selenium metabolism-associated LysR family transcriptional regulator [Thermodesulfovibrionales bacterium]
MDINKLKVFISVFKRRSFSKASEELYLTQPTVSDHIRSLEEELGCRLFDRLGRSIMPTKEAEILFDRAIEIIEKADNLKGIISASKSQVTGEIVVGASTIPGTYILPYAMFRFMNKHPEVQFKTIISDSKDIVEKVLRHELILGIVGAKLINSMINYIPFHDDDLIAVASPSLTGSRERSLRELTELPIVLREEGSGTRRETERILETKRINIDMFRVSGILGSTEAVKEAVKAGMGFSIISRVAVEDELRYGNLVEIKISDVKMKRKFYIVTHRRRTVPQVYNVFIEYLKGFKKFKEQR